MSGSPRQTLTATGGLRVEKAVYGHGWVILHVPSGKDCGIQVRLKRQAEDAMTDLLGTGVDFTQASPQLMEKAILHQSVAVACVNVLARWRERCLRCCDGDEHYDPLTYAMDGRCVGPMSNGKPRRS